MTDKAKTYRINHNSYTDTVRAFGYSDALQFWITTVADGGTYKYLGKTGFGDRQYRVTHTDGSQDTVWVSRS